MSNFEENMKMVATFENQICIVISSYGIIIGRIAEGEVTQPRMLIVAPHGREVRVSFKKLLGDPNIVYIGGCPSYISEDMALNNLYIEEITGLSLITTDKKITQ